jgi:hypothetical protein
MQKIHQVYRSRRTICTFKVHLQSVPVEGIGGVFFSLVTTIRPHSLTASFNSKSSMQAHTPSRILTNDPRPVSMHNNDQATPALSKASTQPCKERFQNTPSPLPVAPAGPFRVSMQSRQKGICTPSRSIVFSPTMTMSSSPNAPSQPRKTQTLKASWKTHQQLQLRQPTVKPLLFLHPRPP